MYIINKDVLNMDKNIEYLLNRILKVYNGNYKANLIEEYVNKEYGLNIKSKKIPFFYKFIRPLGPFGALGLKAEIEEENNKKVLELKDIRFALEHYLSHENLSIKDKNLSKFLLNNI